MVKVRIEYKSGMVEFVEMNLSDYTKNLVLLAKEGRALSSNIVC